MTTASRSLATALPMGALRKRLALPSYTTHGDTTGHPIANNEFLDNSTDLMDTICQLQNMGLTVEGEAGLTVSEKGKEFRASVKFRPREGAISKVLNVFKVNVNLSPMDLL